MKWDLFWVNNSSAGRRQQLKHYKDVLEDPKKKDRRKKQMCRICFYIPRVAGQAFTKSNCKMCDKEITHGNTDVDRLCEKCAKEKRLCIHCGSDIEYKERRTV